MHSEIVDKIIELAISAYHKRSTASEFAKTAAHRAAFEASAKHHAELADFATLVAVATFYIETTEALHFSARVTDKATDKLEAEKNYRAEWQEYSSTTLPKHISSNYFGAISQSSEKISIAFQEAIAPTYESTSVSSVVSRNKAKRAALYIYRDTYATARSAYIRAMFLANQAKNDAKRLQVFQKEITHRLKKELSYDVIDPGLFLKCLASMPLRFVLAILLLASIGTIVLAALHLTPLPFISLIFAGSASSTAIILTSTASVFAKKRCNTLQEENDNRAEVATLA